MIIKKTVLYLKNGGFKYLIVVQTANDITNIFQCL